MKFVLLVEVASLPEGLPVPRDERSPALGRGVSDVGVLNVRASVVPYDELGCTQREECNLSFFERRSRADGERDRTY
jgi:hypothetical protein